MHFSRLSGGLAAACLLISAVATPALAQGTRDAYGNPKAAPSPRPMAPARRAPVSAPAVNAPLGGTRPSGVRFGFRAGLNVADVQGDALTSFRGLTDLAQGAVTHRMRPGFSAGVYATLPLGPGFALEPGLAYSEKGAVLQATVPVPALEFLNTRLTGTARLAYVDVPVLVKAFVTPGFYLYAGPQVSFLVSGVARAEASVLGFSAYKQDFDVAGQLRKVDYAAVGGLGYQFDNGLGLSAGYEYGLASLDAGNRFKAQNRVIKAGLNYSF